MLARKSLLIIACRYINALLGLVGLYLVGHHMGAGALGVIGFGMSFVGLFNFVSDMGFNMAHTKRISEGMDLAKCVGTFAAIKLVLNIVMALLVVGSVLVWTRVMGNGFANPLYEPVIYIFLAYYFLFNLATIPIITFDGQRKTAKSQLPTFSDGFVRVPLVAFVALTGLGVLALAGAYLAGAFSVFVIAFLLFRKYPYQKPDWETFRKYLAFSLPLFLVSSMAMISLYIDKVMIAAFWPSTEVGFYFGAQRVALFVDIISVAVISLLFPAISALHASGRIRKARALTGKAVRYTSMLVAPATASLIVFSPFIVQTILGPEFTPAAIPLQIMALYIYLLAIQRPLIYQISAIDLPKLTAKIGIIGTGLNILGNFILIPNWGWSLFGYSLNGGSGAAIATTMNALVVLIIGQIMVKKLTGTRFQRPILAHCFAAFVMGLLISALLPLLAAIAFPEFIAVGLSFLAGVGLYSLVLYLLRELRREDVNFFFETLNPAKMSTYVKKELKE